jgi:hypothetical protein
MKKILLFAILFVSIQLTAQAPEMISYQALLRNNTGAIIQNGNVGMRISVLQGSMTGPAVYTETHTTTTNENGLITLNIGAGATTDSFAAIDWGSGSYYIKTETDPDGGTNYSITGTSQLLSVPYALYAKSTGQINQPANPLSTKNIKTTVKTGEVIVVVTSNSAYGFSQFSSGAGNWDIQSLNGDFLGVVASDKSIVVYTTTTAYAYSQFNGSSGNWDIQSINGNVLGAISSSQNIVVYTDTTAYAFSQFTSGGGNWDIQSINGSPLGAVNSSNTIVVYSNASAYGFSQFSSGAGNWDIQSLNGDVVGAVGGKTGIVVVTSQTAYAYSQFTGSTGNWDIQSLNGPPVGIIGQ